MADSVATAPALDAAADRRAIDAALRRFCDDYLAEIPGRVADAVRYGLTGEGKRFRGVLFLAAYRAAGGQRDASELAAAIEVVHAYSLVHDDLPCMDDDDIRRGRPTVHRVHGVRAATAAGVAMVPMAARCAWRAAIGLGLSRQVAGRVVEELMSASGAGGMVGGQLLDLAGEGQSLSLEELEQIHRLKTGALIAASAVLGGLAAGAGDAQLAALRHFGEAVGLAFQIYDDVLDVTGTSDVLGKTARRDLALGKSTYPALLGVEGASARASALIEEGRRGLTAAGLLTPALDQLARFIVERRS